jgi:hypothetical protein
VPLFLSKEELDRVWSRMALKGRTTKGGTPLPPSPRVTVTSLTAVMQVTTPSRAVTRRHAVAARSLSPARPAPSSPVSS